MSGYILGGVILYVFPTRCIAHDRIGHATEAIMIRQIIADLRSRFGSPERLDEAGSAEAPAAERSSPLCFIVEDDAALSRMISTALSRVGIRTRELPSVAALRHALDAAVPDLIFLDIELQGSDAVEALRHLASTGFSGSIQLMSGRDRALVEDTKAIGERHGLRMLPILSKPFGVSAVRKVVEAERLVGSQTVGPQPTIDLGEALDRKWVELWYQPKIDLRANAFAGAEGLARVRHPTHGILGPGSFLKDAKPRNMARLTEFAIRTALQDWGTFDHRQHMKMSVNASVSSLLELSIATIIRENRPKSPRWPGLILEVTEDEIVRDIPLAHEIATQLQIYGVTLSIDDFGAGYSSLARLKHFPFVELKLDRTIAANCGTDTKNASLCKMAIDLAHRFGASAVAEGVEEAADLQALHKMDCDFAQGYLLAKPMPREQLVALLAQRTQKLKAAV